jgi:hypothetical protein
MKNPIQLLAPAAFALCLTGCASNSIKQTWKSPAFQGGPVQKVAVLAVDERNDVRIGMENRFARELRRQGQDAMATRDLLSLPEIKADKEAAAGRLRDAGADTLLIVRLVDQATYNHEVEVTPALYSPGASGYGGYTWYDCFSYAFMGMGVVHGTTKRQLYLDSSLFDLNTGRRLWSALTLTELKENADALVAADDLAAMIAGALRKDGLVR